MTTATSAPAPSTEKTTESPGTLRSIVDTLLAEITRGVGDREKRRQVEDWMKSLAEKYPEYRIEAGLRDYYLAEAERLRLDFEKAADLTDRLGLGRAIESFLDRASEMDRRLQMK